MVTTPGIEEHTLHQNKKKIRRIRLDRGTLKPYTLKLKPCPERHSYTLNP